ncbi:uncharacterized protein [Procambarus clarkii]|uniref:uncharacterized protein n=1 Tax=Procambarus clarkii TaxID=6728 RepID=UPI0037431797
MMPGETVEVTAAGGPSPHLKPPQQMNGCPAIPRLHTCPGYDRCSAPTSGRAQNPLGCHADRDLRWGNGGVGVTCNGVTGFNFVTENFCTNGVEDYHGDGSARRLPVLQAGEKYQSYPSSGASFPSMSSSVEGTVWEGEAGAREGRVVEGLEAGAGGASVSVTSEETLVTSSFESSTSEASDSEVSLPEHQRSRLEDQTSRLEDQRSPLEDQRSPLEDQRSRLEDQTSRLEDQRSRLEDQRSPLEDQRSRLEDQRSLLEDPCLLPASTWGDDTRLSDTQLFQEEYYTDELECLDHSQYNLHGATFNLKESSQVHIGPVYGPMPSPIPGVDVTPTPGDALDQLWVEKSPKKGPGTLKVNLVAPAVQQLQADHRQHSPLLQTQSAPEKTLTPPVVGGRPGVRVLTQQPLLNPPPTPQTPLGTFTIAGDGSVVIGTQIIYNNPSCKEHPLVATSPPHLASTAPTTTSHESQDKLESLLAEVRDKLSTVYIRQTKTSFLPWLKGHQVIPMTEFYTESRILAVDKQGRQTSQCVNLVRDLVHEEETRFLVEGEPGMGKTLLALKLAIDWAKKISLQEFKFVFLIFLRDFKGSLEQYVKEELLPSHFEDKLKQVWEYCKKHEEQVLFILDGYDELERADAGEVQKLLSNRDFQNSKVVVTARPDVLKTIAQRTIVKGFSEAQMFEFVTKYFKLVNEEECGRNLKRIIEKDYKYRKLAKRPLFCVLLCMLYGSDGVAKLPEKLTDMMFKIMLCLIKWNKKGGNVDENTEDFPAEYEELFLSFGKLCLQALKTEKTRFSEKEIKGIENYSKLLHLGFLSNDSENDVLGYKKFYKPVHKIFLEYLAGLYMASHIERDRSDCRECREFSKVYRHEHVLKFVVGILGKKAHLALDGRKHQVFLQMKDQELLMLLRETEPTRENCRAVAKLLDRRNAIVYTSEVDFEGWSSILAQNFKKLNSLEIVWRIKSTNPDQESSFNEATPQLYAAFFSALRSNTSITKISIRATQDGEPFSDEKIELFFSHLQGILVKENLRELEIKELKMKVSTHLRKAIEGATCHMEKKAMEGLEILRLDMEMLDDDLSVLCKRLSRCAPNLSELQLTGLVHGAAGFDSLVDLLKHNKNLHKLCISMNKAKLMDQSRLFMTKLALTPSDMHTGQVQMKSNASKNSRDAYIGQDPEQRSPRPGRMLDPTRELHYLFQDPLHSGARHKYEARGYFFINGVGETRLPLPLCLGGCQHQSMFHTLFSALPDTSVRSLALDYPCLYLNTADLVCLGDAIRRAKNLSSLRLLGLKKAEDYMPVLLGLGQSQSLTTVKLDSHNVVLTDTAFQLACTALRNNTTLRSLSLAHWEFNLQEKALSVAYFKDLLSSWKVLDLNLSSCIVDVGVGMPTSPTLFPPILLPINGPIQHWSSIKTLRLSEVKLKEQPGFIRRSHLLLPLLRNCPNLTSLDLSSSHTQATTLDDNAACKFFELLGSNFRKLRELNLGNWEFRFDQYEKTCAQIGNTVRSCGELRMLMLDKVCEVRSGLSHLPPCRTTFLHQLVSNLPRLAELSLCYYRVDNEELDRDTATRLGACFHDHWASGSKFKLKFFGLSAGVETALHEALKKEGVSVVVSQGYPLVFTVKRGYFLRT